MSVDGVAPGSRRIYYRGPGRLVTSEYLVGDGGRQFRIAELTDVRRVRIPSPSARVLTAALRAVLLLGLLAVVLAFVRTGFGLAAGMLGLTGFIAITLAVVRSSAGQRWQLHGMYEGRPTVLYSSIDPREFDIVTRALTRAIEESVRW